ncbi:TonB-dependent receptor domain-containing protein [Methylococcus sp. EFPC2]|uniref:TonB-dependent receptor domain-containing protein n=1 Tax=Methylococcus sp. EFPC2 TaxID=2812648 RepID=UPI0019686610|nr:TonB-dependent receptor [Methylococcus sp. EFPC2]QSA96987.1 TonB-dependent receptor [Methylococcus sp. EFPC2]
MRNEKFVDSSVSLEDLNAVSKYDAETLSSMSGKNASAPSARGSVGLSGAAMLVAGACLLAPGYAAADANSDLAAEVARLKKELGETKKELSDTRKENEQLKDEVASTKVSEPPPSSAPAAAGQAVLVSEAPAAVAEEKDQAESQPKNLSEVVVTARRKEEKLQDVPLPISVIGGEQLKRDNIVTINDIARRVPNLGVSTPSSRNSSIALRGIGKNKGNEAMEGSVGVLVDNVWSWVGSTWTNYVDLDHVELLRGPQGTLQGKNSTVGLLNVNSKLPSFKAGYYFEGFAGNRDSQQARAMATGPLINGLLAYRASVFYDKRDGSVLNLDSPHTDTLHQDTNMLGGRVQFLLTPTDSLSARIILDRSSSAQTMILYPAIADPTTFADGTLRPSSFSKRLNRDWFTSLQNSGQPVYTIGDPRKIAYNNHQISRVDQQGASGEINWDLGGYKLTSITAYRSSRNEPRHDYDYSTADIGAMTGGTSLARQWTQEFRLTSQEPAFGFIDYQLGAFALRSDAETEFQHTFSSDAGAFYSTDAIYNRLNATAAGREVLLKSLNRILQSSKTHPTVTSLAGFGQLNLHVTDEATLTLGFRNTWEKRDNQASNGYTGGEFLSSFAPAYRADVAAIRQAAYGNVYFGPRQGIEENSQSWLVNPSYKLTKDILIYFSTAYGEKSGVAQFDNFGRPDNIAPEKVWDYELGIKTAWLDNTLTANLNLYNTDVEGYQSLLVVEDHHSAVGTRSTMGNVKGITARGVELDAAWQAYEGVSFFANAAYNHAVYTDFKNAPCAPELNMMAGMPCDYTGLQIPNAPEFTANYGVDLRTPLGFGKFADYGFEWHAWLVDSFKSRANVNTNLTKYGIQPSYHVVDGGIGVGTKDGHYSLNLVGRNIFDTIYVTDVDQYTGTQVAKGTYGDARYFGAQFRSSF